MEKKQFLNLGKNGTVGYVSREVLPTSKHTQLTQLHPCKVSHTQAAPGWTGRQCRSLVTLSHLESHWAGEPTSCLLLLDRPSTGRDILSPTQSTRHIRTQSEIQCESPPPPAKENNARTLSKDSTWEQTFWFFF